MAGMFDDLVPQQPAGKGRFDDLIPQQSLEDKYSLVPQSLRDVQRVVMDSMTRGFGDKIEGTDAQNRTASARERLPGIVETPSDILGAVVGAPYRVTSVAGGALAGGLEGAASAYGNQKNWIPDWEGAKDIGEGAVLGSGLGAVGAKVGEWAGAGWNRMFPEAPVQGPSLPPSDPKLSKVGSAVHFAAGQPLQTTVPVDVALHTLGLPPLATGASKAAKMAAPFFKYQPQPGAGPVQPESQAAAALRDYFAKMLAGYGRSQ